MIANHKDRTCDALRRAGVPVPRGAVFDPSEVEGAVQYAVDLGSPVVVKPRSGRHGMGVSTDLRSADHVRDAIATLATTKFGKMQVIVEEFMTGNDYRMLVVGDRVVSAVLKIPANVVGDGTSTVAELVREKNEWRGVNPHARSCPLRLGRDAAAWLERQQLGSESVPGKNQRVRLGSAGNVSAGGESVEVLDQTHPDLLALAVRAAHAIPGLDHAGVDLIGDHRTGLGDGDGVGVLEVNAKPATSFNHFPMFGTPRDVSRDIVLRNCALAGFKPGEERDELGVRVTIEGHLSDGFPDQFARLARERDVAGSIRKLRNNLFDAHVAGRTNDVWVLASGPLAAGSDGDVHRVSVAHQRVEAPAGRFEVLV